MRNPKALLGFGILCLALASFGIILTRSDEVMAQYNSSFTGFYYQGIPNVKENVYSINFGDRNTMFVTGGDEGIFYMSTIPVVVNGRLSTRNEVHLGVSNILGGDNIKIGKSDNITVIGGEGLFGNNKVVDDYNDNATFFGGSENSILGGMSSDTPTVLLGGMKNKVEADHNANAIVGGSSNTINQGAKNVNILGGTSISIDGDDVIAGGQEINGVVSDSFVFNDGNDAVDLAGSGMFFLGVANGVGFGTGTQEGNQGAISNGAVKLGSIDIQRVECTSENVGLLGLWNGCMVGCTSGSAMGSKWEMLGYGSLCEQICKNSDKCMAQGWSTLPNEYPSFCVTGFVDISNATMCTGARLDLYRNVIFEAYLLDSDEECPEELINQCVFRCNDYAHLTGDKTGKMSGDTKCFNDCPLPWSGSQYRGHNEIITGYSVTGVDCSDGAGHPDTCAAYKKQLMCVNGRWYEMEDGVVTNTENTDYNYETCTLNGYSCDTSEDAFNLTREDIVNGKEDFIPSIWAYSAIAGNSNSYLTEFLGGNIVPGHIFEYSAISWTNDTVPQLELSTQEGVRGMYELCIDYTPEAPGNQAPQNEEGCHEAGNLPGQYHYKFIGCNTGNGYEMAEDGVCRKGCEYNGQEIKHGSGIVLYTGESAICPEMCGAKNFVCYDGTLYADLSLGTNGKFVSGTALDSNIYNYTGCTLSGSVCDSSYYNIDEETYQSMKDIGVFSSCQSSWAMENLCVTGNSYHLDSCNDGYYMSEDTCLPFNQCQMNNSDFEDLDMYFITNPSSIGHYTLMDRNLGASAYYNELGKSANDWNGCHYQWGNNYGFPSNVSMPSKTSSNLVDASLYGPGTPLGYYSSDTYILANKGGGNWLSTPNDNLWGLNGSESDRQGPCPTNYHVPTMAELQNLVNDYGTVYNNNNQRMSDSLMPVAGYRRYSTAVFDNVGTYGYYWTTSASAKALSIQKGASYQTLSFNNQYVLGDGFSVRCFKNLQVAPLLTIDAKGGTGALIIVHGNKVTKLGTPVNAGATFGGWYWNEGYTLKAKTGDTVSAPAYLYAKWVSNECTGTLPSGNGVLTGSITYPNGYTITGWTYKANGELGACEWRCADGYIQGSNNTCVDNFCANNHSDFKDLDMYFIINPTSIGHYTFMDRNLGASAYMGQPGKSSGDWNGCYYQWGNNYGFPNQGAVKTKHQMVDTSVYSWSNPYLSDTFTVNHSSPYDWSSQKNDNLWGDTTDTPEARQGPCPEGYHVPTRGELVSVVDNYRKKSANYTSSNMMTQRGLDTLMPFAGHRSSSSAGVGGLGSDGIYWSSSSDNYTYSYSYLLSFSSYDVLSTASAERRSAGYSVRCLKNSVNQLLTIDSNGGTGALIIVHGDEITKLGTPHKGSETFGGWYWDDGYALKAKTGDKISAPAYLYAKWGNEYTVTFDSNRGTAVPSQTVAGGSTATRPDNPEFPGYDFLGWYLTGSSTQFNFSTPITSDIILYAKWQYALGFEDLDMYFVLDGGIGHYTLMDRNLGAAQVYNGTDNVNTYGYYYQWGNNYGFPNQGTLNNISTTRVNTEGYGPNNPYSSGTFIRVEDDWSIVTNENLWGDVADTLGARQGPCPDNYHVPVIDEFTNITNYYKFVYSGQFGMPLSNGGELWALDALMPFARGRDYRGQLNTEQDAWYWASSITRAGFADAFHFGKTDIYSGTAMDHLTAGLSVRCFKNSLNQLLTIDAKGGTGAVIIVHGNEITKLGTPHKGNMVLEGWYSDQSFIPSSQVRTGDTVSAGTHLYAKWGCAEGYVQSGDNCVVVYNCEGETPVGDNVEMGASTGFTQMSWTYKAEGELGACEWRCHEGYIQSGNTCELAPSYECVSDDYMFNTGSVVQIVGILPTSIGDVEKQLFASEDAIPNGQACAYVCNEAEGYHYFSDGGGICAKCEDGTESEVNGQLVCTKIIDVCPDPDDYVYVPETHKCVPYGNCTRGGVPMEGVIPVNTNVTNLNSARPIGTSLMEWSCYPFDRYWETYTERNPNQCLYTCQQGYTCGNKKDTVVGCVPVDHCKDDFPDRRMYALTGMNPVLNSNVGYTLSYDFLTHSNAFVSKRYYLSSVEDASDFFDEVDQHPERNCWFRCPESHLCKLDPYTHQPTSNQDRWKCYETESDRDTYCIEQTPSTPSTPSTPTSYLCTVGGRTVDGSDYTLGGYSTSYLTALGQNREFQTYPIHNGIAGHLSEGCYQGCTANALSGAVEYNGSQVCWRQCPENQYFDVDKGQGCKSCADPSKKPNPDDMFLGNAMSCIDKCPEGSVRGSHYGIDGGEGCRFAVDAGQCPQDVATWRYDQGDGRFVCVRNMES